ncbi:MAG TPA: alpha/beta hydrolase-fold protein [Mycobacteriales bacterium]|nr:alpha/beta hydrolase-fold protein [Mycobacteriales bacterium]
MRKAGAGALAGLALVLATGVVGTGVAASARPAAAARLVTITIPARHATIPSTWLSYSGPPRANVLLPAGYNPHRRYPLLMLLHGLNSNYAWYAQTGLAKLFDGLRAIVVMPEGGSGWYTDWWNNGRRGDPSWETYELDDVLPAVLSRYRIRPQRRYHAIVGISMGGLGAAYLGGRLPGYFGTVASLSGFVDPEFFAPVVDPAMGLTSIAPLNGDYYLNPVDGPPNGFYMRGHNPTQLAANLRHTRVFEATGTGMRSSIGRAGGLVNVNAVGASAAEGGVIYPMSRLYHRALLAAGVRVTYRQQPGGHDIPDFGNEIRALLKWGLFKRVVAHPTSWVNRTVATGGKVWDVAYRFHRAPTQLVRFHRSGRSLSVSGAGSPVTLRVRGCVMRRPTPAVVRIPRRACH